MPVPEPGQSWGIFGGLFDPVHLGHLALARNIQIIAGLDGVLLVPAFAPPHRREQPQAPFSDRIDMIRLAIAGSESFLLSDIEKDLPRPGYTLGTIQALKKRYSGVILHFIMGADNLDTFVNWYRSSELLDEIDLLVGHRTGAPPEIPAELSAGRVRMLDTELVDISSTLVREAVRRGAGAEELSRMVPRPVADYICEKKLYL